MATMDADEASDWLTSLDKVKNSQWCYLSKKFTTENKMKINRLSFLSLFI